MIQRMLNRVAISIPKVNLLEVYDIEVTFEQKSSGSEFTYSGDSINVFDEHLLVVTIPKEDAMQLDDKTIQGQVMYTQGSDPWATKPFSMKVDKLLKEEGYGS